MRTIEELESLIRHLIERVNRLEVEVANLKPRRDAGTGAVDDTIITLDRAVAEIAGRSHGGEQ